jgi:hypothetical protein
MNLLEKLAAHDPKWRENISPDPLEAAVEVGLLEPEALDADDYKPLDFNED